VTFTEAVAGATLTETGAVMVMVAEEVLELSATEVALSVTVLGEGTFRGAVKVTEVVVELERVPQVAPLQPVPDRAQVTPLFWESFCNVAVKFWVPMPACTLELEGATVTTMTGASVTVIVAVDVFEISDTEVAVRVTVDGEGTLAGAV